MDRRLMLKACLVLGVGNVVAGRSRAADVVTQERAVAGFDRVIVHGVMDVAINQGTHERLRVTAEPRLMANIVTRVKQGTLTIETVGNVRTDTTLRIDLSLRELRHLEADGSADVRMDRLRGSALAVELSGSSGFKATRLDLEALKLRLGDSADATLSGTTRSQIVQIAGSASYQGDELESASAQVKASGSASATISVRDALDAELGGSADLTYIGNPKVRKKVGAAASLERG